jgi:hypothetical protein
MQHPQNMHQRPFIQQIQQQQQQKQNSVGLLNPQNILRNQHSHFSNGNGSVLKYQYHHNRQSMSRSQIDLPSTSRQLTQDLRIPVQEVYYHYHQNRTNRFNTSQIHSRNDSNNYQDNEFQKRNSRKGIEKAVSQPQLSYDEGKTDNNNIDGSNLTNLNHISESGDNKETYEMSVDKFQVSHFSRNNSKKMTMNEHRPETSVGIYSQETRLSSGKDYLRDLAPDTQESTGTSIKKRIEELHVKNENESCQDPRTTYKNIMKIDGQKWEEKSQTIENIKKPLMGVEESNTAKRELTIQLNSNNKESQSSQNKDGVEHGIAKLKVHPGSGSDYDKAGQSSSNVDSGRGSAVYSSGRRLPVEDLNNPQG